MEAILQTLLLRPKQEDPAANPGHWPQPPANPGESQPLAWLPSPYAPLSSRMWWA